MDMRTQVAEGGNRLHALKTHPEPFEAAWRGLKRFEFRADDRGFEVGDTLKLVEYDPESGRMSGRFCLADVTYVCRGRFGIPDGYCVMSITEPLNCVARGTET